MKGLLCIFKGFIHWNPGDSAVFQKGYNRICADSDEEHFQVDLRVDPQSNPAGNAGQHHLPEHHTHNRFLNRQAQQEADYNHNRCGPNVQFADFTVCIKAIASVIHGSTYIFHYRVSQNITDNCANQASLTGESMPAAKRPGSPVYAGTIVEEGRCVIAVEKASGSGRYDRVVRMIEESEKLKSTPEDKAARMADKLVPYTFGGTALTYLVTRDVTKMLAVLMVDFSCRLRIRTSISVLKENWRRSSVFTTRFAGKHGMQSENCITAALPTWL